MSFLTERLFQVLEHHRLYAMLSNIDALRFFLERYAICAWSYSALLQSIQREMLSHPLSLRGESDKEALRLVSELVLQQEVRELPDGRLVSHMELYLEAMQEAKCDLTGVINFLDMLENNVPPTVALDEAGLAAETVKYGRRTLELLVSPLHVKAAALFYEGEPFLPDRFLYQLDRMSSQAAAGKLLEYLESHIEGINAPEFSSLGRIVELCCRDEGVLLREAEETAEGLLAARIELWNEIAWGLENFFTPEFIAPTCSQRHLRLVVPD